MTDSKWMFPETMSGIWDTVEQHRATELSVMMEMLLPLLTELATCG